MINFKERDLTCDFTFCSYWKFDKCQRKLVVQLEFSVLRSDISPNTDQNVVRVLHSTFLKKWTDCASHTGKENNVHCKKKSYYLSLKFHNNLNFSVKNRFQQIRSLRGSTYILCKWNLRSCMKYIVTCITNIPGLWLQQAWTVGHLLG